MCGKYRELESGRNDDITCFFWSSFSPQVFPLFFLCNLRFLLLLPVILDRKRRATNGQSSFFPLRISIATISLSRKTEKEKKEKSSGEDPALKKVFVGKQSFILYAFSKFAKIGFFYLENHYIFFRRSPGFASFASRFSHAWIGF